MKYYYKEQLVKKSKKMEYKFTIANIVDDHAIGAYTTYENAVAELKRWARMRADWCKMPLAQAFKELSETHKIVEFTRIEA